MCEQFQAERHYRLIQSSYRLSESLDAYALSLRVWPVTPDFIDALVEGLNEWRVRGFFIKSLQEEWAEFFIPSFEGSEDQQALMDWLSGHTVQYALVPIEQREVKPKLMVFDMDSTLIQMECIDELARQCGFYDEVSAITEQAMRGELDFSQSLRQRVALLKDLPESTLEQLASQLPVTRGVPAVVDWAKQNHCRIAVVSGGFVPFVERLKQQLGLDYALANTLEQNQGVLTGRVLGDIVDGERKKEQLKQLRSLLNLRRDQVWAIGDGANDLPMMSEAGLGVAFDAKPKVKKLANAAICEPDMNHLLRLLEH